MAKKEYFLITAEECSACHQLKKDIKGKLASDVKEVDLLSDEGTDLGMKVMDAFQGIPAVIATDGDKASFCPIEQHGDKFVAKCPSGDKELN